MRKERFAFRFTGGAPPRASVASLTLDDKVIYRETRTAEFF